jgi:hypothetical protein
MRIHLILALVCLTASPWAAAALQFEQTTIEKDAKPTDEHLEYRFKFKVTGPREVTIKEIRALCDCLTLRADKSTYRAGESGVIHVKLQLGALEGEVAKSFNVITDDPAGGRLLMRCVARIPSLVEVSEIVTRWHIGEPPRAKTVTVQITGEEPLFISSVKATGTNVTPSFKEILPGKRYEITLSPKHTAKREAGMVKIETSSAIKKYAQRFLYFQIIPDRTKPRTLQSPHSCVVPSAIRR